MPPKFTAGQQAGLKASEDLKAQLMQRDFDREEAQPLLGPDTPVTDKDRAAAPAATYTPINIEDSPTVTETEGTVPTSSALLEEGIEQDTGTQPFIRDMARVGVFSREINDFLTGKNLEEKQQIDTALTTDLTSQAERGSRLTPQALETKDPEEFITNLGLDPVVEANSVDKVSNVLNQGDIFNQSFQYRVNSMLRSASPEALKLQNFLVQNKLFDTDTSRMTDAFGNALSVSFLEIAREVSNKFDDANNNAKNAVSGDAVTPDAIRERITTKLIDKLVDNPNQAPNDMRTGFGGAGALVDPEVKSMIDLIGYEVFADSDYFNVEDLNENDDSTTLVDQNIVLSDAGQQFLIRNQEVLDLIHPDRRINVSYAPPIVEGLPGRERELGEKATSISRKNKSSKNTVFEDSVKLKLSSIPMRIDKDGYQYAKMMVDSEITMDPRSGFVQLLNKSPDGFFFSKGEFAKVLGLNEAKWLEARENAKKRYGENIFKANEQADKVMRMRARSILRTMDDATQNLDKVFYNKYQHASSVGRFFVLNTVLNAQQDKSLSRGMVLGARKLIVDLKNPLKGESNNIFKQWKYIIGKNLLDPDLNKNYNPTNGLRTEDMTWGSIEKLSDEVFNNPNGGTYNRWLKTGQALKIALANNNMPALKRAIEETHTSSFLKSGEWGFKLQSYIDFANYHEAKTNGTTFEMRATTQHDGKQNGIAIQAMQNGDPKKMLERVGMLFNPNAGSVIPQGDIRDSFLEKFIAQSKIAFDNDIEKQDFWADFVNTIKDKKKFSPEDRANIVKALSKTPLMETSYGMPIQYHMETALKFLDNEGTGLINEIKSRNTDVYSNVDEKQNRIDLVSDLNKLIGLGLKATLDLEMQRLYKKAGMMWAMLGVTPSMKGPLGTDIFMGTNEHFKTGKTVAVEGPDGTMKILELTQVKSTGSAPKLTRNRVYDEETDQFKMATRSRFGQLVANQLPVLTVQQIDAAIMARTIDAVNKNFYNKRKFEPAKFVIPVHDAIITNADGVNEYHREINNQFKKVNMEYSINQSVYQGLSNAFVKMRIRATTNPNKLVNVSYDSRYRALHDQLVLIEDKINEQLGEYKELTGLDTTADKVSISLKDREFLNKAKKAGWNRDSSDLKLSLVFELIDDFQKNNGIFSGLKNAAKLAEIGKARVYAQLDARGYQYN